MFAYPADQTVPAMNQKKLAKSNLVNFYTKIFHNLTLISLSFTHFSILSFYHSIILALLALVANFKQMHRH